MSEGFGAQDRATSVAARREASAKLHPGVMVKTRQMGSIPRLVSGRVSACEMCCAVLVKAGVLIWAVRTNTAGEWLRQ